MIKRKSVQAFCIKLAVLANTTCHLFYTRSNSMANSVTRAHHAIILTECALSRLASLKCSFALILSGTQGRIKGGATGAIAPGPPL